MSKKIRIMTDAMVLELFDPNIQDMETAFRYALADRDASEPAAAEEPRAEKPKQKRTTKKKEAEGEPQTAPDTADEPKPAAEKPAAEETEPEAPPVTRDELRRRCTKLASREGNTVIQEALKSAGVTMLDDLPESKFADFMKELKIA